MEPRVQKRPAATAKSKTRRHNAVDKRKQQLAVERVQGQAGKQQSRTGAQQSRAGRPQTRE